MNAAVAIRSRRAIRRGALALGFLALTSSGSGCALLVDGHWSFPLSSALMEMDHERTQEWEERPELNRFDVLVGQGEFVPMFFAETGLGHWSPFGIPLRSRNSTPLGFPLGTQEDTRINGSVSRTHLYWLPIRWLAHAIDLALLPITGLHDLFAEDARLRPDLPRLPRSVEAVQ